MQIPDSLIKRLEGMAGFDGAAFVAAHELPAPVSVRYHPIKGTSLPKDMPAVPWCSGGIYLPERPVFTLDPAYHAGAYYVQEASSMFLQRMLKQTIGDRKNLRVLDLCAAPGGKSSLTAALLDSDSLLISNEVIRSRASILEENMSRWGYINSWVCSNDPRDLGRLKGYFDIIIVDAPCSGSGLWRKDANAINEWSEANVAMCATRQQRILEDVLPALKTGGTLIYATCSYSPEEDEEIMDWLADTHDVAGVATALDSSWGIEAVSSPRRNMPGYRFFPGKVKGEGFFIAAAIKGEKVHTPKMPVIKPVRNKKVQEMAQSFFALPDVALIPGKENNYNAILPQHEADLQLLQKAVYMRKTGLDAGMPAAKDWLPAHDIALSIDAWGGISCIDVTREQALLYLKREDMGIDDIGRGWHIIKYNGLGLGWVKGLGNRVNNYLPKQWRIRMEIEEN